MKKNKLVNIIIKIVLLILLIVFCYSGMKVLNWFEDNKENRITQKQITEIAKTNKKDNYIDIKKLKKINNDAVAYLKVNNTNIDYAVVKGNDNSYYLTHNFRKKDNIAGWVFASYHNKFDGSDKNIVIFGHNMRDGSMFGTLKNVLTKKWYKNKDNLTIKLITEKGVNTYRVFSVYQIEKEDYYITTNFNNNKEYNSFIKTIKNRSIKNFNVNVTSKDKVLTLSTCSMTGKERVVLHAKKM